MISLSTNIRHYYIFYNIHSHILLYYQVMEMKKIQCAGGTCQGEHNPTWLKQPGDTAVAGFGALLIGAGSLMCIQGIYRLATGKGKKAI
jgi:hypothetical protein